MAHLFLGFLRMFAVHARKTLGHRKDLDLIDRIPLAQQDRIDHQRLLSNAEELSKMPGMKKTGNVIMKKGIFKGDNNFWGWFNQIKVNTVKRIPVTISLLDEAGNPTMLWTLANAWPTRITGTDLKAAGNELAIDSIEIVHEGFTRSRI